MCAELLYTANLTLESGDQGLVQMSEVLDDRYGEVFGKLFLVGFWVASFTSLIGVWSALVHDDDGIARTAGQPESGSRACPEVDGPQCCGEHDREDQRDPHDRRQVGCDAAGLRDE